MKGEKGEPLVVVAGGIHKDSKGFEVCILATFEALFLFEIEISTEGKKYEVNTWMRGR